MSTPNDGGPAFPLQAAFSPECGTMSGNAGMSLRDWFAGQALAMLAAPSYEGKYTAERAYAIADAMLKAREGKL